MAKIIFLGLRNLASSKFKMCVAERGSATWALHCFLTRLMSVLEMQVAVSGLNLEMVELGDHTASSSVFHYALV